MYRYIKKHLAQNLNNILFKTDVAKLCHICTNEFARFQSSFGKNCTFGQNQTKSAALVGHFSKEQLDPGT